MMPALVRIASSASIDMRASGAWELGVGIWDLGTIDRVPQLPAPSSQLRERSEHQKYPAERPKMDGGSEMPASSMLGMNLGRTPVGLMLPMTLPFSKACCSKRNTSWSVILSPSMPCTSV